MIKQFLIILLLIMAFTSAIASTNADTIYTYYDGAGNKYKLTKNKLEFIPIKTIESSSGMYSGGSYKTNLLLEREHNRLVQIFNTAMIDKKVQTLKNIKPNAVVEISFEKMKKRFILKATSEINESLNQYLKQLIKN